MSTDKDLPERRNIMLRTEVHARLRAYSKQVVLRMDLVLEFMLDELDNSEAMQNRLWERKKAIVGERQKLLEKQKEVAKKISHLSDEELEFLLKHSGSQE